MYIITGGAGFLGSGLIRELNRQSLADILVVDHLDHSEKWRNLVKCSYADYLPRERFIEMIRQDRLPFKAQGIVHLGACSSTTEDDADFLMQNNFHYSRDLCAWAVKNNIRFINASSAATYGAGENGFDDNPAKVPDLRPLNMYGYSKQLFDLWLLREKLAGKVASLKFFNVYGPNEYHKGSMSSVVWKIWQEISAGGGATLFASSDPALKDGEQKRDFVYMPDCARLMAWLLLERPDIGGIRNVGTGQARTFNDLAKAVFAALGKKPHIRYMPMPETLRKNYQNYTCADMKWLENAGYPASFQSLEEGTGDYVRNYLEKDDKFF